MGGKFMKEQMFSSLNRHLWGIISINAIMPIIEYNHFVGICVSGGYVSYSREDACAYGA